MKYISLFSGIEAASVAWGGLSDWQPLCFSEVSKFPSDLLATRYPEVPNLGDITKINWGEVIEQYGRPDLIVGGSPCQSFSTAGKREGLQGASGLMFEYIRAIDECRPEWFIWENVKGCLSVEGGEAFRCLLKNLDEFGYGMAWRVLDAKDFGCACRRPRVFVIGHFGDKRAAEVFNDETGGHNAKKPIASVSTSSPEGRYDDNQRAYYITRGFSSCNGVSTHNIIGCLLAGSIDNFYLFYTDSNDPESIPDRTGTLWRLRRMMPVEWERAMGFPEGYTDIPGATRGSRMFALGNSMAVPVMRWLGEQIDRVDKIIKE